MSLYLPDKMLSYWAKDGIRTRDPDLGKVVLYQLSYFRLISFKKSYLSRFSNKTANLYNSINKPIPSMFF